MSTTTTPRRPTLTAYTVRDYERNGEKKSDWRPIGVAFAHRDQIGFDLVLDAIPVNGRIALRKSKPKSEPA
jgi:hypothetical protein